MQDWTMITGTQWERRKSHRHVDIWTLYARQERLKTL